MRSQEGWDCPFAYILVSLNNTGSGQSMTQLVGRILRQPNQERTPIPELNESYVFCLHKRAGEIARDVKKALEKEGYEGDLATAVVDASDGAKKQDRMVRIRQEFLQLYTQPFEGKIYLPHFCVKDGKQYEPLDYYRHLISTVKVHEFEYGLIDWPMAEAMRKAKDRFYRITLGEAMSREYETDADWWETDDHVRGWLAASLRFEYLSHKQLRSVVERACEQVCKRELDLRGKLALVKFVVRDHIERWLREQLDRQTEQAFVELFETRKLLFYLECAECRFEIPNSIQIKSKQPLTRDDGSNVMRSLFDYVEHESANQYERAVAICIDEHPEVLWWYRNLVGKDHFSIQGYRRDRIRPDFVVQTVPDRKPVHKVLVVESKGQHLQGNPDTTYKRNVANYFEQVGKKVSWQRLGRDFKDHVFRFQVLDQAQEHGRDWKDELRRLLDA